MGTNRTEYTDNFPVPIVDPVFQKNYDWEKFDYPYWRNWMGNNWHWTVKIAILYVTLIFIGRQLMKNRDPFKLRKPLMVWNTALAIFSCFGFYRIAPEMFNVLSQPSGFYHSVCTRDHMTLSHVFWEWICTLSKVIELGDTAFVVLRKQPLFFLHWYHHASVMLLTWYAVDAMDPVHRWFMFMNYFIHGAMYTYYALRAAGFKLPRPLALMITTMQLSQMAVGIVVNCFSVYAIMNGWNCARRDDNIYLAFGMYASYLILFANFFVKTYVGQRRKAKSS